MELRGGSLWSDLGHGDEQDQLLPKRKVEGGGGWDSEEWGKPREYTETVVKVFLPHVFLACFFCKL